MNKPPASSFTPAELRKLRSLKDPYGIQRYLDDMPYHLADTAWSPRRVLRENTSHCLEGAIFAAAALRANGFPPLICGSRSRTRYRSRSRHLPGERPLGRGGEIQLHRLPLSRAGLSLAARTGHELFQSLFQPAAGADPAYIFPSGKPGPLRSSALDDHGETHLVHRGLPASKSTITSCCGPGMAGRLHRIDERLYRAETLGKAEKSR